MTSVEYPEDWNHESHFPAAIEAAIRGADCGWLQAVGDLGFAVAAVLLGCENEAHRVAVAEVITTKILEAARTGRMPGEVVQ